MDAKFDRIPSLDGLRTISIALVIIGHLLIVQGFEDFGNFGNLGVRVFFVISGFLITGLLLKELEKTDNINLHKFYFRRTLRIFPPFYFYLLIIFILSLAGFFVVKMKSLLVSATYLSNYIPPENWLLGHSWSLAVEEQFYLLFPGILLLLGIRKTKLFLIFLVGISPLIRITDYRLFGIEFDWVNKGFHSNMDALAIGCLLSLFYIWLHQNGFYKKIITSRIIFIVPILVFVFNIQYEHPHIFFGVGITMMNLMIAFCIDWAVTNYDSFIGKILNSQPLVLLGMMSYSIYLWQQPFFNPKSTSFITQFPFNFIGLTIMTLISYYLVERYSLRWRKSLETKLFDKKLKPPTELELQTQKL